MVGMTTTPILEARDVGKKRPPKATLYVEIPEELKKRLDALAARRLRKITAEAILAIQRHVDEEDAKDGITPTKKGGE